MGFLNNSTNNIQVDAVLTEAGREAFASNGARLDESGFVIVKFGLSDDEVDYTYLQKYGLELGKERIEKLTPVFEASTHSTLGVRNFLTTFANPDLERMPQLATLDGTRTIEIDRVGNNSSHSVKLELKSSNQTSNDQIDTMYLVRVPDRLLRVDNATPIASDPDRTVLYQLTASSNPAGLNFTLSSRPFSKDLFQQYAPSTGTADVIRTRIWITGITTGATVEILVNINDNQ